jgi:hypothetical protein
MVSTQSAIRHSGHAIDVNTRNTGNITIPGVFSVCLLDIVLYIVLQSKITPAANPKIAMIM